jgi:hypothetical protein
MTRSADNILAAGALAALLAQSAATIVAQTNSSLASTAATIIDSNGTVLLGKTAGSLGTTSDGAASSTTNTGTSGVNSLVSWDGAGGSIQLDAAVVTLDSTARTPAPTFHLGTTSGSSAFFNGYITRLTGYNSKVAFISPNSAFTITQLAQANQIYQRDTMTGGSGKGTGVVRVTVNVTTVGQVHARTRSVADGVTIVQGAWLPGVVSSTGSQTFNVSGVNAGLGWFYLDLSQDGVTWQLGTTPVGMGELVALSGQSQAVRQITKDISDSTTLASLGITPNSNGRVFVTTEVARVPTAWTQFTDGTMWSSAGGATALDKLITMTGVNCGFIGLLRGGTRIGEWQVGTTYGNALYATLDAAGGKFGTFFEYLGDNDSVWNTGYTNYMAGLSTFFTSVAAHNSFPSPTKLVATMINQTTTFQGSVGAIESIKRAGLDWANANGATYLTMHDITLLRDGIHEGQQGSIEIARHVVRAMRSRYGLPHGDNGITQGTPTHPVGVNIIVPYTLASGATTPVVAGHGAPAFKVYQGGDRSSPLAYDATTPFAFDNAAKTFTLKLASDPGQVPLTVLPYGPIDPVGNGNTNQIWDDLLDGDGITVGRNMTPGSAPLKIVTSRDLTGGGTPAYSTGNFGQAMSGGYGTLTSTPMPGLGTGFTFEARVKVVTPDPVNTQTIFGSVAGIVVSVLGNDLIVKSDTSTARTYTGALPTGSWVHVAVTNDGGTVSVFVWINGIKNGTQVSTNFSTFVANNPWSVRRLGNQTTNDAGTGLLVGEVAAFDGARYTTNFTPPFAAYIGNEAQLIALYHLDSGLTNSAN